jgi:dihydropteroate synthase
MFRRDFQRKFVAVNHTFNCRGRLLSINRPLVMGILNATPDSFYRGGEADLLQKAGQMLEQGADLLDLGAMSSRPGAEEIGLQEELDRLMPVLLSIRQRYPEAVLSIDTYRAAVAEAALDAGAHIINDITFGDADPRIFSVAAAHHAPYIGMHMQGTPRIMQINPQYENILTEVMDYFIRKLGECEAAGLSDVILDPGFGFGKTVEHNYALLRHLRYFQITGKPILAGLSRKSMICKVLHCKPEQALNGTTALHMLALQGGASILRVHDVREAVECVRLFHMFEGTEQTES